MLLSLSWKLLFVSNDRAQLFGVLYDYSGIRGEEKRLKDILIILVSSKIKLLAVNSR